MSGLTKEKATVVAGVGVGFIGANILIRPLVNNLTSNGLYNAIGVTILGVLAMSMDGKFMHLMGAGIAVNGAISLLGSVSGGATA